MHILQCLMGARAISENSEKRCDQTNINYDIDLFDLFIVQNIELTAT